MWFCLLPFLKIVQIKVYFVKEFYYLFNNFLKGSSIASWDYIYGRSFPSWMNKEHIQAKLSNINSSCHPKIPCAFQAKGSRKASPLETLFKDMGFGHRPTQAV